MNARTRIQLLAVFAASTVLFAAGCDQRNADRNASTTGSTPSTPSTASTTSTTPATTSPGSMAANTPSTSMAASVDDATITTKVKAAVMAEPNLKSTDINVDTKDGVVTLAGTVNSQDEKQKANSAAQSVQGVKSVSDQLVVKPS
jgi:hypothetical protein